MRASMMFFDMKKTTQKELGNTILSDKKKKIVTLNKGCSMI